MLVIKRFFVAFLTFMINNIHTSTQKQLDVGQADKALLFFKLHELQTMSWGVSKIGRVAQYIDCEKVRSSSQNK